MIPAFWVEQRVLLTQQVIDDLMVSRVFSILLINED